MLSCRLAARLVCCLLLLATGAQAQDVTLTSRDGAITISGTLLGYDGEFYRVDSPYGPLTVDGSAVSCAGPGCPDLEHFVADIGIHGASGPILALIPPLLEAFAEQQDYRIAREESEGEISYTLRDPQSRKAAAVFHLHPTSSAEGIADLLAEEADMAISLRPATAMELRLAEEAGLGRLSDSGRNRVLALDALVPVVSPRNPVQQISLDDLARIYSGEEVSWAAFGGVDAPVEPYLPEAGSGPAAMFVAQVMTPAERQIGGDVRRVAAGEKLDAAVVANPFAIGMNLLSRLRNARPLGLSGGCNFHGSATPEAVKSEDYPLNVPVLLYLRAGRFPVVGREFLRFLGSPSAQIAILRAGYVDQSISRTPLDRQGRRLANAILAAGGEIPLDELKRMVRALDGARRLSITFRFEPGARGLNAQSRSNVALLARALELGTLGAREILFVGFSDGEGQAEANRILARERAKAVRDAVRREAAALDPESVKLRIEAFGEAMPMACDESAWGRRINRRVEVWVR